MRRGLGSPRATRKRLPAAGAAFSFVVTVSSGFTHRVEVVAKPAVQYACTECGTTSGRWFGKCPGCATFGTLVEEVVGQVTGAKAPPKPLLRLVDVSAEEAERNPTGVTE